MEGHYEDYKEPHKVAVILGWLGDKGHQIYASIDWVSLGKDRRKFADVLEAFALYFKPMQTTMHTWYQLGNIYSCATHVLMCYLFCSPPCCSQNQLQISD